MTRAIRAFSRSLPMLLLRSHQAVMAQFRPVLRAHGITEQQWRVLRALASVDEARITRLAELTLISKPSLSRLLPALEMRRLVKRSAAADDARGASMRIAPAGLALIDKVAPHSEARYRDIGERVGEAALAELYALLPRLAQTLEATPVRSVGGRSVGVRAAEATRVAAKAVDTKSVDTKREATKRAASQGTAATRVATKPAASRR
ncbi:MAG: homoprotocatechuate degradation operon regulator HpaR [Burkholderiaceae bacterium]